MKKLLFMLLFVTAATMTVACGGDDESTATAQPTPDPTPDPDPTPEPDPTPTEMSRYVGGDISMLTKYEEAGVVYKDKNGNAVQPLAFFKQEGLNAMRVRLFVDPSQDSDKGVCQDLDYVKALGKRIKGAGMAFMLDFHYSDTWADPAKQWTPNAWKTLDDAALAEKVYE